MIAEDPRMNNVESQTALSIYFLAIALGPLVLGPLFESYGRSIITPSCNIWFVV